MTFEYFVNWTCNNASRLPVIALSCFIIYVLMVNLLCDRRKVDPSCPSSFFALDQVMSGGWFRSLGFFFGGSLAILYAAISLNSGALLSSIHGLLLVSIQNQVPSDYKDAVAEVSKSIPLWLEPLVILLIFLLLFAEKIRLGLVWYRDAIIGTSGLYSLIDDCTLDAARELIAQNGNSYDAAALKLERIYQETPIPEEFVNKKDERRLAYQLIWVNMHKAREDGFLPSFSRLKIRLGLALEEEKGFPIRSIHLASACVLFAILMGLYAIIVPTFADTMVSLGIKWPNATSDGWSALIRYLLKNALALVFPLMLALNMYPVRKRAYRKESAPSRFAVVATAQWILAFVVLELFNLVDVAIAMATKQNYSFWTPRIHIDAFLYALVPVIAFTILLISEKYPINLIVGTIIVSAIVGISFGLCDIVYECYLPKFDYNFWYQSLLGLYIMLSFLIVGFVTDQLPAKLRWSWTRARTGT